MSDSEIVEALHSLLGELQIHNYNLELGEISKELAKLNETLSYFAATYSEAHFPR